MASSPPSSPPQRPMSGAFQAGRSQSRLSYTSKQGGGSRNSDDDGKLTVSVKVGMQLLSLVGAVGYAMLTLYHHPSCANPSTAATD